MSESLMNVIYGESVISIKSVATVPRVGDELRLPWNGVPRFFVVTRVVWCYDEANRLRERVNITVEADGDE